jgi:hypothetical protein
MRVASSIPQLPFVGRDHELTLLRPHLATAVAGRGSLVLISGEAGVGKSALAATRAAEATARGAMILAGHCYHRTCRRVPWPFTSGPRYAHTTASRGTQRLRARSSCSPALMIRPPKSCPHASLTRQSAKPPCPSISTMMGRPVVCAVQKTR